MTQVLPPITIFFSKKSEFSSVLSRRFLLLLTTKRTKFQRLLATKPPCRVFTWPNTCHLTIIASCWISQQPDAHVDDVLRFCLLLGRTKKKIQKLVTIIKLVIAALLIKLKIFTLLYVFGKLMEFKMVILVGINTLINVVKLFLEWKKSKNPNNVVHYEEAHHEHIHDSNHFDKGDKGWLGGLWSRNDFIGGRSLTDSHGLAYSAHRPVPQ